jgi:transposase
MTKDTIGVDISKGTLDAYRSSTGERRQFLNGPAGCSAFIAWAREDEVERVVFEPTGPSHRTFERALGKANVPISKINPRHARRFAEATGSLAKTDRVPSRDIASQYTAGQWILQCWHERVCFWSLMYAP